MITAPDYEGETLTATKGSKKFTGTVKSGVCRIAVDEEGEWVVSGTDGNSTTVVTDMTFEGTISKGTVYGVKVTTSESDPSRRVTYIDDASEMVPITMQGDGYANLNNWSSSWIFEKIYPVMLSKDGTIAYKLDPNNQTFKAEGGSSDVSNINFNGNAMVCFEKFYTKFSMDGEDEIIEICDKKKDGFEAIGFIREDGSEADCAYAPMFLGSVSNGNQLRSIGNQTILYSKSWGDCSTYAHNYGSGYEIEYWALDQIIQILFKILTKSTNYKYLGDGRKTDAYNKKTGVLMTKGPIYCDLNTKAVKFLWIEDFYGGSGNGMMKWETGVLSQNEKLYVKMKPPYSGTNFSGYSEVTDYSDCSGNISKLKCSNLYGEYPVECRGSSSTYDMGWWSTATRGELGVAFKGSSYALNGRNISNNTTNTYETITAALTYLPPA